MTDSDKAKAYNALSRQRFSAWRFDRPHRSVPALMDVIGIGFMFKSQDAQKLDLFGIQEEMKGRYDGKAIFNHDHSGSLLATVVLPWELESRTLQVDEHTLDERVKILKQTDPDSRELLSNLTWYYQRNRMALENNWTYFEGNGIIAPMYDTLAVFSTEFQGRLKKIYDNYHGLSSSHSGRSLLNMMERAAIIDLAQGIYGNRERK